jgi:hypothetical protein
MYCVSWQFSFRVLFSVFHRELYFVDDYVSRIRVPAARVYGLPLLQQNA